MLSACQAKQETSKLTGGAVGFSAKQVKSSAPRGNLLLCRRPVGLRKRTVSCGPGICQPSLKVEYCLQEEVWVYVESLHEDYELIFGRLCTPCHILGYQKDSRQVTVRVWSVELSQGRQLLVCAVPLSMAVPYPTAALVCVQGHVSKVSCLRGAPCWLWLCCLLETKL